jgi:hypothetical protein
MMIEMSDCITLLVSDKSDCSSSWTSVSGIWETCSAVNVGRNAEIGVFVKPATRDVTMAPIRSIPPYTMLADTDRTSRMTRRTQSVMNVPDTDGFTMFESCL